jgi:dephospho-CoA kinase
MVGMPEYSRIVVGVAGRLGSGKSEVAHSLEQGFGFQYLRYSMILADWLGTDPRDKSRLQEFGWDVMAGEGQYELNRRLIDRIHPTKDVAVDGLRHPIDYESLRGSSGCSFR